MQGNVKPLTPLQREWAAAAYQTRDTAVAEAQAVIRDANIRLGERMQLIRAEHGIPEGVMSSVKQNDAGEWVIEFVNAG